MEYKRATEEPPEIAPPAMLSHFRSPLLRFITVGKYLTTLTGEKDKVLAIVKPNLVIAALRGTLTQSLNLQHVLSFHLQQCKDKNLTDVVITSKALRTTSIRLATPTLQTFLEVALYFCPLTTSVHELSTNTLPISECVGGVKKSHMSALFAFVQHVGQDDMERAERIHQALKSCASPEQQLWLANSGGPHERELQELHEAARRQGPGSGEPSLQVSASPSPKPRDASSSSPDQAASAKRHDARENSDDELLPQPPTESFVDSIRPPSERRASKPVFGRGGAIIFPPRLSVTTDRFEEETLKAVVQEVRQLRQQITVLQTSPAARAPPAGLPVATEAADVDTDTDEPRGVHLDGSPAVAEWPPEASIRSTAREDHTTTEMLPLLSAATQEAAMNALEHLQEVQQGLAQNSSKTVTPAVAAAIKAMCEPLRTLHRLLAPSARQGISANRPPDILPVWALVDFGEVNYNVLPLMLKQYHRLVAHRTDTDQDEQFLLIATRQQFAVDEGYISVPFSSITHVMLGGVPRPTRALRLTMEGLTIRSDEFYKSKSCLSIRTRLQGIVIQFESDQECDRWFQALSAGVRTAPVDVAEL